MRKVKYTIEMPVKPVSALYEPINVYKPFARSVGIADGPFEHVTLLGMKMPWPFSPRMTIVQLASGDLFLHSPIAFDAALAAHLQSLGRVRHLVSPNRGHYAHIWEWARAFPEAVAWASPGVRSRSRSQRVDVQFQRDLTSQAPPDWRDEIDQTIIPGAVLDEAVFFHRDTKTLIVADTIMNFEPERLPQPYRLIARLVGICSPGGGMCPTFAWRSGRKSGTCAVPIASPLLGAGARHSQPRTLLRGEWRPRNPARFSPSARRLIALPVGCVLACSQPATNINAKTAPLNARPFSLQQRSRTGCRKA